MTTKMFVTAAVAAVLAGGLAGCGGGGGTTVSGSTVSVSGTVADGYLRGAEVFLDKNGTYQWDGVEPHTVTGAGGAYALSIAPADMGKYPIVVRAMAGSTVDEDTGQAVQNSYVMSAPAGMTSFVSPLSTLVRAKMDAGTGMTANQAIVQLRNQLDMPAGMDVMADYMAGSRAGQYQSQYQAMHQAARQMAAVMAGQAGLVMNGSGVNRGRYQLVLGMINQNMPRIANNAFQGMGMNSTFMTNMMTQLRTLLGTTGFGNYSGMFRNMTSLGNFWNYSGGRMRPGRGGGMRM